MTTFSRENAYAALFTLASNGEGLTGKITWGAGQSLAYTSRRVKLWDDLPAQPALCQAEHGETLVNGLTPPYLRILKAMWLIFHKVDDGEIAATTDNQILDAVELALKSVPGDVGYPERNTLGGIVENVFIDGAIIKVPGDLDGQALIAVPISIQAPLDL